MACQRRRPRIADTGPTTPTTAAARGGRSPRYEQMIRERIYERAGDIDIQGRSRKSGREFISPRRGRRTGSRGRYRSKE
jgi:hypothetical protein